MGKRTRAFQPECYGSYTGRICTMLPCEVIPQCAEFTKELRSRGMPITGTPGSGFNTQLVQPQAAPPQPPQQAQPAPAPAPAPMLPQPIGLPQLAVLRLGMNARPDLVQYVEGLGFRVSITAPGWWEGASPPEGVETWRQWSALNGVPFAV